MHSIFARRQGFEALWKDTPITSIIIIINIIMYIITVAMGGPTVSNLVELGGLVPVLVKNGEIYRLVASGFLHGSLMHFVFNVFFGLLVLSSALERIIGSKKFLLIYLGSLVLSALAITYITDPLTITIGASGAIYGAMGSLLYIALYRPDKMAQRDVQTIFGLLVINVIFSFIGANISIMGHASGVVSGLLLSFLVIKRNVFKVIN